MDRVVKNVIHFIQLQLRKKLKISQVCVTQEVKKEDFSLELWHSINRLINRRKKL
jgi:hypothetical protein